MIDDYHNQTQMRKDMTDFTDSLVRYSWLIRTILPPTECKGPAHSYSHLIKLIVNGGLEGKLTRQYQINKRIVIAHIIIDYSVEKFAKNSDREDILDHPYVSSYTLNRKQFGKIFSKFGNFRFRRMFTDVSDDTVSNIFSEEERKSTINGDNLGDCHNVAMDICTKYKGTKIVTGLLDASLVGYKMHHSWIEDESENCVYDFCFNLFMPREDYYSLFQPIIASKISHDDLISECQQLHGTNINYLDYLMERETTLNSQKRSH